jgi:hypothetical protein
MTYKIKTAKISRKGLKTRPRSLGLLILSRPDALTFIVDH